MDAGATTAIGGCPNAETRADSAGTLAGLFDPRSVAVVGASASLGKWGNWIARGALEGRERRSVYLISKRSGTIDGCPVHTSLSDLPEPPELVVISVPLVSFETAVEEALQAGARYLVGITAGMGESGEAGREREARIVERVRADGARLLGPNCMGIFDAGSALNLSIASFVPGHIGLISQSGNLALELDLMAGRRSLGFSRVVSLGNQADIEAEELLEAFVQHEPTRVIMLYLEGFRDGRKLIRAARSARDAGKPVVLLTVGASDVAARAARSHTGSLASNIEAIDAACRTAGIIRVSSPEQAIEVVQVLSSSVLPRGRRLAIVADGGGHGVIAADLASSQGLSVPVLSDAAATRLSGELPPTASTTNPIDLAGGGEQDFSSYARVVRTALASGEVDGVLLTGFFGGYSTYSQEFCEAEVEVSHRLADAVADTGQPLIVHTMHFDAVPARELRRRSIPVFASVETALRAYEASIRWGEPLREVLPLPLAAPPATRDDYWSARELLIAAGLSFPQARLVHDAESAQQAAMNLRWPLVVKAQGLLHKSDLGGVVLDIRDLDQLVTVVDDLFDRLQSPAVSIEEMAAVPDGIELIVGARWCRSFGPLVLVGLGGIYTEVLHDVAVALAPIDEATALDLIRSLRGAPLLLGARGRPAVDIHAAARFLASFSIVAASHPEIAELEVNPLLVTPSVAVGLDARIVLS